LGEGGGGGREGGGEGGRGRESVQNHSLYLQDLLVLLDGSRVHTVLPEGVKGQLSGPRQLYRIERK
jgi:hypothetical protein